MDIDEQCNKESYNIDNVVWKIDLKAENHNTIKEGQAEILVSEKSRVFYNPVQEFNRDISIVALTCFAESHYFSKLNQSEAPEIGESYKYGITVLEALSASGLRSIRYAKEIPYLKQIVANDISRHAVDTIKKNLKHNNVHLVETSHADASMLMYQRKNWDAIDLDPYGCPSRFLDSAVQSVAENGLLLITCTDMAVLAGNTPETCYLKYGAISLRNSACHEMAIRIVLQCIESHANRYGRYITPLLSLSADFYIRVVVRINTSPFECKKSTSKLSHVFQCVGCKSFYLHPLGKVENRENKPPKFSLCHLPELKCCEICHQKFNIGGPIWSDPIFDEVFVKKMLDKIENSLEKFNTSKRMKGLLYTLLEEIHVPLYYTIDSICSVVHCTPINLITFRSALLNAGYRVSLSHATPNSIKTEAPNQFIWDTIRTWIKNNPVSKKRLQDENSVVCQILKEEIKSNINLKINENAKLTGHLMRYQINPIPNWGPGNRAKANLKERNDGDQPNKKIKIQ